VKRHAAGVPVGTPREVAGFRILRALGGGASARVFLAEHPLRHRPVAVKLVHADLQADTEELEDLLSAVQRARGIRHPNLERLIEVLRAPDGVQIISEYLPGGSLRERLKTQGRLPAGVALGVVRHLLAGLSALHARGLVHRDVKPGNVLFDADGRAVLVDYGLLAPVRAQHAAEPGDSVLAPAAGQGSSRAGQIAGTAAYMSPEQARGEGCDARADLYSLGVLLFELLTGRLPYPGDDPLLLAELHASAPVPELPAAVGWLQPLVDGLMAKPLDDRLASAQAAQSVLETLVLAEPAAADLAPRVISQVVRRRDPPRLRRAPQIAAVCLLLAGMAVAVGALLLR
jgi:serine/threonine-protein kinase PpkA